MAHASSRSSSPSTLPSATAPKYQQSSQHAPRIEVTAPKQSAHFTLSYIKIKKTRYNQPLMLQKIEIEVEQRYCDTLKKKLEKYDEKLNIAVKMFNEHATSAGSKEDVEKLKKLFCDERQARDATNTIGNLPIESMIKHILILYLKRIPLVNALSLADVDDTHKPYNFYQKLNIPARKLLLNVTKQCGGSIGSLFMSLLLAEHIDLDLDNKIKILNSLMNDPKLSNDQLISISLILDSIGYCAICKTSESVIEAEASESIERMRSSKNKKESEQSIKEISVFLYKNTPPLSNRYAIEMLSHLYTIDYGSFQQVISHYVEKQCCTEKEKHQLYSNLHNIRREQNTLSVMQMYISLIVHFKRANTIKELFPNNFIVALDASKKLLLKNLIAVLTAYDNIIYKSDSINKMFSSDKEASAIEIMQEHMKVMSEYKDVAESLQSLSDRFKLLGIESHCSIEEICETVNVPSRITYLHSPESIDSSDPTKISTSMTLDELMRLWYAVCPNLLLKRDPQISKEALEKLLRITRNYKLSVEDLKNPNACARKLEFIYKLAIRIDHNYTPDAFLDDILGSGAIEGTEEEKEEYRQKIESIKAMILEPLLIEHVQFLCYGNLIDTMNTDLTLSIDDAKKIQESIITIKKDVKECAKLEKEERIRKLRLKCKAYNGHLTDELCVLVEQFKDVCKTDEYIDQEKLTELQSFKLDKSYRKCSRPPLNFNEEQTERLISCLKHIFTLQKLNGICAKIEDFIANVIGEGYIDIANRLRDDDRCEAILRGIEEYNIKEKPTLKLVIKLCELFPILHKAEKDSKRRTVMMELLTSMIYTFVNQKKPAKEKDSEIAVTSLSAALEKADIDLSIDINAADPCLQSIINTVKIFKKQKLVEMKGHDNLSDLIKIFIDVFYCISTKNSSEGMVEILDKLSIVIMSDETPNGVVIVEEIKKLLEKNKLESYFEKFIVTLDTDKIHNAELKGLVVKIKTKIENSNAKLEIKRQKKELAYAIKNIERDVCSRLEAIKNETVISKKENINKLVEKLNDDNGVTRKEIANNIRIAMEIAFNDLLEMMNMRNNTSPEGRQALYKQLQLTNKIMFLESNGSINLSTSKNREAFKIFAQKYNDEAIKIIALARTMEELSSPVQKNTIDCEKLKASLKNIGKILKKTSQEKIDKITAMIATKPIGNEACAVTIVAGEATTTSVTSRTETGQVPRTKKSMMAKSLATAFIQCLYINAYETIAEIIRTTIFKIDTLDKDKMNNLINQINTILDFIKNKEEKSNKILDILKVIDGINTDGMDMDSALIKIGEIYKMIPVKQKP